MHEKYDVVIVGAGPAGIAAAIYASRSNLKCAIVEKEIILILVSETDKEKIMKAIASEYGISSEANSVTFAVPVDESVGVNV